MKPRSWISGLGVGLAIFLALPSFYVLSLGPVAWLYEHGAIPPVFEDALETFYQPLSWLCVRNRWVMQAVEVYQSLWVP